MTTLQQLENEARNALWQWLSECDDVRASRYMICEIAEEFTPGVADEKVVREILCQTPWLLTARPQERNQRGARVMDLAIQIIREHLTDLLQQDYDAFLGREVRRCPQCQGRVREYAQLAGFVWCTACDYDERHLAVF